MQLITFQPLIGLFFKHAKAEQKNADAYKKKCVVLKPGWLVRKPSGIVGWTSDFMIDFVSYPDAIMETNEI